VRYPTLPKKFVTIHRQFKVTSQISIQLPLSGNRQMIKKKPVQKFLYLHRHLDRYQSLTGCCQSHSPKKNQRNSPTTFCVILLYRQTHKGKNVTVFEQECTLVSRKGNSGVDLSQNMGSGSVRSSHQTVSDYTLSSILTQVFHSWWWCETCRVVQQQFWTKECDIFGSQNTLDSSCIFSGGQDPQPSRIYAPEWKLVKVSLNLQLDCTWVSNLASPDVVVLRECATDWQRVA